MYCGETNVGQVVLAHSNSLKHGKGIGTKSHDIPAYLCGLCHSRADGRIGPHLSQQEREMIIYEGVYNSFLWLLREGRLVLK